MFLGVKRRTLKESGSSTEWFAPHIYRQNLLKCADWGKRIFNKSEKSIKK